MKKVITGFFMSWGMFCAIPCPLKIWDEKAKGFMLLFLPVIGLILGAIWALCAFLLGLTGLPALLIAGLLTIVPYLLTGFIHLDGYMDCSDAILSRRDLPERRRILKDSHTGAFAVIALCILMLLTFSFLSAFDRVRSVWVMLFIPAAVRSVSALCVMNLKPMEGSSYQYVQPAITDGYRVGAWIILALLAVLPLLLFGREGFCAPVAQLAALLAVLFGRRQLDGMNGDISGYAITIGECVGMLALILL
ncbi:MAG: adenosylcobinamide-GDP ribazoletransferase [Oscillospiraceae bacterium]|nr:adenosylcobinamide-GDP ribazoletransferase [Oscillospiraceae bacterium]